MALGAPEFPGDSGSPVRPDRATASAPNLGTVDSPTVHAQAPEGLMVQGPPDSSTSPEVGKQAEDPHVKNLLEDDVTLEVWEKEMQDLR